MVDGRGARWIWEGMRARLFGFGFVEWRIYIVRFLMALTYGLSAGVEMMGVVQQARR